MKTAYWTTLEERISQACYQHILPHLDQYRAEPDIEQCFPLMEPRIFAAFAVQACTDVAGLVVEVTSEQYRRGVRKVTTLPVALRDLQDECGNEPMARNHLSQCLMSFARALESYAPVLARFQQMAGQAHQAAWHNGIAVGEWASGLFNGLAGILVAAAGGYIAGSAIDREMQAECQRLQQAFQVMLQAYDQAMANLTQSALRVLRSHHRALMDAVRRG